MANIGQRVLSLTISLAIALLGVFIAPSVANAATGLCDNRATTADSHDHVFWVPINSYSGGYSERCYLNQESTRSYNKGTIALQDTLKRCYGQGIAVDGKFGPNTRQALLNAQRSSGAVADGKYGPESRSKLRWPARAGSHGGYLGKCERVSL